MQTNRKWFFLPCQCKLCAYKDQYFVLPLCVCVCARDEFFVRPCRASSFFSYISCIIAHKVYRFTIQFEIDPKNSVENNQIQINCDGTSDSGHTGMRWRNRKRAREKEKQNKRNKKQLRIYWLFGILFKMKPRWSASRYRESNFDVLLDKWFPVTRSI